MHVRVAVLVLVLGRRRCTDDGRIDDGAFAHLDPVRLEVLEHILEQGLTELVLLEQMTEPANGRLVRGGLLTQVETNEAAHRDRIIERILGGRIGQIESLLQEIDAKHHLQFARRATIASDRIDRRNQLAELGPGDDAIHVAQELGAFGRLRVLLEAFAQGQLLTHRAVSRHVIG